MVDDFVDKWWLVDTTTEHLGLLKAQGFDQQIEALF